ncbi:PHD zinc finger-containing protein, partial [Reticulomyxa filosa]
FVCLFMKIGDDETKVKAQMEVEETDDDSEGESEVDAEEREVEKELDKLRESQRKVAEGIAKRIDANNMKDRYGGQSEEELMYQWQINELEDTELAIEWLMSATALFGTLNAVDNGHDRKEESKDKSSNADYLNSLISAHLHITYAYLKLECWEFAFLHAQKLMNLITDQSSHQAFLAKAYAAECCIHLNRIREARAVLDPHTEQTTTTEATPRTSKDHHHFLNSDQEKEKEKDKEKEKEKDKDKDKDKEREKDKQKTLEKGITKNITEHEKKERGTEEVTTKRDGNEITEDKMFFVQHHRLSKYTYKPFSLTDPIHPMTDEQRQYCIQCTNIAASYVVEGELRKGFLWTWTALRTNSNYYPALRMLVYLHIREGNIDKALEMLKKRKPVPIDKWITSN